MGEPREKSRVLVTVTGPDTPGITAALTSIIAENEAELLDIEQVVVQGRLTLCLLLCLEKHRHKGDPALKDLFSTPGGMPGPDWVNTGRSVPGVGWYDLTTARMWGQHVFDYAPGFGPGVGILWR